MFSKPTTLVPFCLKVAPVSVSASAPIQGMEPTAPVAAPAAPAPAAVLQKGGLLEGGDLDLRRWCLSWRAAAWI